MAILSIQIVLAPVVKRATASPIKPGADPVVMTGGDLYSLLHQVADRAYHWGTDDVAHPGWDD